MMLDRVAGWGSGPVPYLRKRSFALSQTDSKGKATPTGLARGRAMRQRSVMIIDSTQKLPEAALRRTAAQ
jgi:hypothetical protein